MVRFGLVRWISSGQRQFAPSEMSLEQQQVFRLMESMLRIVLDFRLMS
jgi:hypothetical protein